MARFLAAHCCVEMQKPNRTTYAIFGDEIRFETSAQEFQVKIDARKILIHPNWYDDSDGSTIGFRKYRFFSNCVKTYAKKSETGKKGKIRTFVWLNVAD